MLGARTALRNNEALGPVSKAILNSQFQASNPVYVDCTCMSLIAILFITCLLSNQPDLCQLMEEQMYIKSSGHLVLTDPHLSPSTSSIR